MVVSQELRGWAQTDAAPSLAQSAHTTNRSRQNMRNLILIAALLAPVGNYIDNGFYLIRASVEPVAPTQQSIEAANTVVGIECSNGLGSATHIGNGLFISAHHVVDGCENEPIAIVDHHLEKFYKGKVVAFDVPSDLVLIKADNPSKVVTPVARVGWDDPVEGEYVHGVGFGVSYSDNRAGCERRLWSGIVSDYTDNIGGEQPNCIQSTNPAIPGDSGGALFNDRGELIGVIHATDYIHTYSIRTACIHKLLRRYEHAEQKEAATS